MAVFAAVRVESAVNELVNVPFKYAVPVLFVNVPPFKVSPFAILIPARSNVPPELIVTVVPEEKTLVLPTCNIPLLIDVAPV